MKRISIPLLAVVIVLLGGCAANAKMAEKRDPIFRLHDLHIVERDLTIPQP